MNGLGGDSLKSKWKAILAAAMAVCLLAGCAPAEPEEASAPRESSAAPTIFADAAADFERLQFETQDLEGNVCDSKELFALHDLTLVNIWATWCGPCQMLAPVLEELSQQVKVVKVDVDENPQLAMAFQVSSIPTVISFRDGKGLKKSVGVTSKEALLELLK